MPRLEHSRVASLNHRLIWLRSLRDPAAIRNLVGSTLLSWGIIGLEARRPHRLEACATGNLTK